jgi:hypothetical protein
VGTVLSGASIKSIARSVLALNYSTTSFSESNTNDGSIATSIIITLSNDTFVGANGSEMNSEYYTTSNVP